MFTMHPIKAWKWQNWNEKADSHRFWAGRTYLERYMWTILTWLRWKIQRIYFVNFIDNCSRFTICIPVSNITAKRITRVFEKHWLRKFPSHKTILCVPVVQYTSEEFQKLCRENNIKVKFATKNNPQETVSYKEGIDLSMKSWGWIRRTNGKIISSNLIPEIEHS